MLRVSKNHSIVSNIYAEQEQRVKISNFTCVVKLNKTISVVRPKYKFIVKY